MRLQQSIHIRRAPEDVFAYLAQHSNHAKFIEENSACEQLTPGPMQIGTRVKNVARVLGREMVEEFEIVAFQPPNVLGKSSCEGSRFRTTDRFELASRDGGTEVTLLVTGEFRTLGERVLLTCLSPIVRRSLRRSLARLKDILETGR